MAAKQRTFDILNQMEPGTIFKGVWLWKMSTRGRGMKYPDTILRYMREWRAMGNVVKLVSKPKSTYMRG